MRRVFLRSMFQNTTHTGMSKAASVSLTILLIVAAAGLWMRGLPWVGSPFPFDHLRHAHSHLAFLGWLFSAYALLLTKLFAGQEMFRSKFRKLFWWQMAAGTSLFPAFLWQGYAALPIALLTLHTALAIVYLVKLYRHSRGVTGPARWFFGAALGFFTLSSIGPFFIPFIQVFGGGEPSAVRDAVHFYLHFHYSGWFVFGFLAMVYRSLEMEGRKPPARLASFHLWTGVAATLLYYLPTASGKSLFVSQLAMTLDLPVKLATWAQLAGAIAFAWFIFKKQGDFWLKTGRIGLLAIGIYLVKSMLEWLVLLPGVDSLVRLDNRWLVICWLHLLFLGMATPGVWWQYRLQGWMPGPNTSGVLGIGLYLIGFVSTEVVLLLGGIGFMPAYASETLLTGSALLLLGITAAVWPSLAVWKAVFQKSSHARSKTFEST